MISSYPEHPLLIFHDSLYSIIRQTIGHRKRPDFLFSRLICGKTVHSISITAHPNLAIMSLAERENLINNPTLRIIQLIRVSLNCKKALT